MPFSLQDIDQVFKMVELLDNTEELIEKFKPEVKKYLVKKDFFRGPAALEYHKQFDQLIISLIKRELIEHFPSWTGEDILLLTDLEFIKMIAAPFFDQKNYLPKEGVKNVKH